MRVHDGIQEILRKQPHRCVALSSLVKSFAGVLADRFEHPKAVSSVFKQAVVNQRIEIVDGCAADFNCCLQAAATSEDSSTGKQYLLLRLEQAVAPLNRCAKGALALGQVTGAAREERQPLLEPRQQLLRRKRLGPRSSKLDRERQA